MRVLEALLGVGFHQSVLGRDQSVVNDDVVVLGVVKKPPDCYLMSPADGPPSSIPVENVRRHANHTFRLVEAGHVQLVTQLFESVHSISRQESPGGRDYDLGLGALHDGAQMVHIHRADSVDAILSHVAWRIEHSIDIQKDETLRR